MRTETSFVSRHPTKTKKALFQGLCYSYGATDGILIFLNLTFRIVFLSILLYILFQF